MNKIEEKKLWKALQYSFDYKPDLNKLLLATAAKTSTGYRFIGYLLCLVTFSKSRINFPLYKLLDIASKLRIQVFWTTYLKHRFSATSYWTTLPLLNIIKPNTGIVLDIGCGMGIFSYVISKRISENSIICQNLEFAGLYLAKKYFVPNANFICSDAGTEFPFSNEMLDVVFSCDAIQYVSNKEILCSEIARMLNKNGIAILAHNHNPLYRDYASQNFRGDFFHPKEIENILKKCDMRAELIDEHVMYDNLFSGVYITKNTEEQL
ncbi:MAG: methyltransferase domain-containing protein [Ignavibacteriae bacterium]|nr:methyltransferase domain-containing protein [Ignavibacteriota bacterium]